MNIPFSLRHTGWRNSHALLASFVKSSGDVESSPQRTVTLFYGALVDSTGSHAVPAYIHLQSTDEHHRYCIFWPPLFSILACLLLVAAPGWGTPAESWKPPLIPLYVVHANHTLYTGMTPYSTHAQSPITDARSNTPYVQYVTSHIYSVRPLASRSSPARLMEPSGKIVGRD